MPGSPDPHLVNALAASLEDELIAVRRDIHAHPEVARTERRTSDLVAARLEQAGLSPRLLPGTGVLCDIGPGPIESGRRRIALRADLDALPLPDTCGAPWSSTVPGVAHACGHDVHVTAVLGAGLVLAELAQAGELTTGVRLIFQPAEEVQPGGAMDLVAAGGLDGVEQIFALHCDPKTDVGQVGTRIGPITSASDEVRVTLSGSGGHTSRPHLTADVIFALGQVITQVPTVLGRRLDPRSGVNLTWGMVESGHTHNAIPATGTVRGTLRCLDVRAWEQAARVFEETVREVATPYGVAVEVRHERGVPPVQNDAHSTGILEAAARDVLGSEAVQLTEQSLGGEDFAWYLTIVPGAMARLGTRAPGGRTYDLHQGDFTVDERAVGVGVRVLAHTTRIAGAAPPPSTAPLPGSAVRGSAPLAGTPQPPTGGRQTGPPYHRGESAR